MFFLSVEEVNRKLNEKSNCHPLRLVGFCDSVEEGGFLGCVRKPMVWASQVEIQAAVDLCGVPIYLFTPNTSGPGYH